MIGGTGVQPPEIVVYVCKQRPNRNKKNNYKNIERHKDNERGQPSFFNCRNFLRAGQGKRLAVRDVSLIDSQPFQLVTIISAQSLQPS